MMYALIFILSSFFAQDSNSPEQVAFNYFATDILSQNYPKAKKIYFTGKSEGIESIAGSFSKCFDSDNEFSQFYYAHKDKNVDKIDIECEQFSLFRKSQKPKSKQLNFKVYRTVSKDEIKYVYLLVFKENNFVHHYLMKLSDDGQEVIDYCLSHEVM